MRQRWGVVRRLKGTGGVVLLLLLLIWVGFALLPEDSGVAFGLLYRVFFTGIVLVGAAFFWLLERERIPQPRTSAGVMGSVALVYLATVGLLVAVGIIFPQFEKPTEEELGSLDAIGRGERIFWNGNPACIQCHSIDGRGATRGPDLTDVASRAPQRVAGLSAEEYLREKIRAGLTYQYQVPNYAPIMPPFMDILIEEQLSDVIAYLLGPR
ncbi:MAG: c-type cytochrome [Chloroflexi bacterium]|nr:c-type cytochrome [Chloroflexota bacterium]